VLSFYLHKIQQISINVDRAVRPSEGRSEAFVATGFNKIFLGDQPHQMNKRSQHFEDRLGHHIPDDED
jgi:hypothetical protein